MHTQEKEPLDWEALERQDWHLWILAILLMFVLGLSLLSFMFPTVFWFGGELALNAPQRAFFGFCVLLALLLVYLLQRQATIRRLKRQLYKAQSAATAAEQAASLQAFNSLPEVGEFRDSLAMEYRRASGSHTNLAVVLLDVSNASRVGLGEITSLLRNFIRRGETLFRVSEKCFGLILPGMESEDAAVFAEGIKDRIGIHYARVPVTPTIIAYPEEVSSLAEFEGLLRTVIS